MDPTVLIAAVVLGSFVEVAIAAVAPAAYARLAIVPLPRRRVAIPARAVPLLARERAATGGYRDAPARVVDLRGLPGARIEGDGDGDVDLVLAPERGVVVARRRWRPTGTKRFLPVVRVDFAPEAEHVVLRPRFVPQLTPTFAAALVWSALSFGAAVGPGAIAAAAVLLVVLAAVQVSAARALTDRAERALRERLAVVEGGVPLVRVAADRAPAGGARVDVAGGDPGARHDEADDDEADDAIARGGARRAGR